MLLNGVAQRFDPGHRLRISLSTSYWRLAWPPPRPTELVVHPPGCRLFLPVRPPDPADADLRPFGEAEGAAPPPTRVVYAPRENWRVVRDLASGETTLEVVRHDGHVHMEEIDLEVRRRTLEWYSYLSGDFTSVRGETFTERSLSRAGWSTLVRTRTVLVSDVEDFVIHAELDAYLDGARVYSQNWNRKVPRRLV